MEGIVSQNFDIAPTLNFMQKKGKLLDTFFYIS